MQRQVKFRGRNITTGEWVYGCLVNNLWTYSEYHSLKGQAVCEIIVAGEADDWSTIDDDLIITVDPATVGQLTGLSDKNGKEIYEGDILKGPNGKLWVVEWKRCGWWVNTERVRTERWKFARDEQYHILDWIHYLKTELPEIVGNINEHASLLENK